MFERNPNGSLWEKVQQLSEKEDGKIEAINIIFEQQYNLPEENIELIKKLAQKEQPKNIRLHIAKSLEKNDNIPYGMYADLLEILTNDPDQEVQKPLENTSLYKLRESYKTAFKKILPDSLTNSLNLVLQKQEELKKTLQPFSKNQTTEMVKQIDQMQKMLGTIKLEKIKIPQFSFDVDSILLKDLEKSKSKGFSADVILTKAAESNPKIKEAVESKKEIDIASKTLEITSMQVESLKAIARNIKGVEEKQNEQHIEQMSSHQKTHDRLSPRATIGIALIVGFVASILGAAFFSIISGS